MIRCHLSSNLVHTHVVGTLSKRHLKTVLFSAGVSPLPHHNKLNYCQSLHLRYTSLTFYMFRGRVANRFHATLITFVYDDDERLPEVSWMFTIACCSVVGLKLGLGFDLI